MSSIDQMMNQTSFTCGKNESFRLFILSKQFLKQFPSMLKMKAGALTSGLFSCFNFPAGTASSFIFIYFFFLQIQIVLYGN